MIKKQTNKIKKSLKLYFFPILSGTLMGTSFIPFPPWAIFFCYVPLWLFALKHNRLKHLLIGGWFCQFIFGLITGNWVTFTIKEFGFLPWPVAILGFIGFASFANLHIPIALLIFFIFRKIYYYLYKTSSNTPLCVTLTLPALFALFIQYYPMIFKWHFGYTWFYANWPAAHTAQIWGFQFIHTLILFSNLFFLLILQIILQNKTTKQISIQANLPNEPNNHYSLGINNRRKYFLVTGLLALWISIFTMMQFWGSYLKHSWPFPSHTASILVIQPNIKNNQQRIYSAKSGIMKKLFTQTQQQLLKHPTPHLILWPEGAYPYIINAHTTHTASQLFLQKQVQLWNTPLALSAIGEWSTGNTNSIFVFNQNGQLAGTPYNKTKLLAFGEYMPGEKWLPINKWLSYYGRSFQRGTGSGQAIYINNFYLGFQICYEGLFDDFTRNIVRKHPIDIILNVTNDSWFGFWQEPWQHLYITMARAIEVRRPLVRGTNTGFSAMISAKGDLQTSFVINKSWNKLWEVPYNPSNQLTTFASWGYYINPLFLWIWLSFLFLRILQPKILTLSRFFKKNDKIKPKA